MRLLNCKTLEFQEYYHPQNPSYAILSHRWENDEVTFEEMMGDHESLEGRKGFQKIKSFCATALDQGITHAWVDTCCINKNSSAELTEAINSMWAWYCASEVCYTYLHDFKFGGNEIVVRDGASHFRDALAACEWFYRGWTLQELIGPRSVFFFDCNWNYIDDKLDLAPILSSITSIPEDVLTGETDIHLLPIAQRMSWVSKRQCTRLEDMAYSLMGLFDVNMPMLYGEGPKAFTRLQQEILKQTYDHTIFLWHISEDSLSSMLAPHPSTFKVSWKYRLRQKGRRSFEITNNGLAISVVMQPWLPETYIALLDCEICFRNNPDNWVRPGIFLRLNKESDLYERVMIRGESLGFMHAGPSNTHYQRQMDIKIDLGKLCVQSTHGPYYGFQIRTLQLATSSAYNTVDILARSNVSTKGPWDREKLIMELPPGYAGNVAVVHFPFELSKLVQAIKLGFDFDFQPICILKITLQDRVYHTLSHSPSRPQGLSPGDTAAVSCDVSVKPFHYINCMEDTGWDHQFNSGRDGADRATICLKPPQIPRSSTVKGKKHFSCWRSAVTVYDYRRKPWKVDVMFTRDTFEDTPDLIWKFDIYCKRL